MKKSTRLLSILAAAMLLLGMLSTAVSAETATGSCGANVTWEFTGSILFINGTGPMDDFASAEDVPWQGKVVKARIAEGVTSIGAYTFDGCLMMHYIELPSTLERVGDYAFRNCRSLPMNEQLAAIENVGVDAFKNTLISGDITEADRPNKGTDLGENLFSRYAEGSGRMIICGEGEMVSFVELSSDPWEEYRSGITVVEVWEGVTSLGKGAFLLCTNMTEISLPQTLTRIEDAVFARSNLQQIEIPDSVSFIGHGAFRECMMLSTVELPAGLETMQPYAFNGCENLKSVWIPASLEMVDYAVFGGCGSLAAVYYEGTEEQWAAMAKDEGNEALQNVTVYYNAAGIPNGWTLENGSWAYYVDGLKKTDCWVKDSAGWCYLGADGYCVTETWMKDSKGWVYLDASSRMAANKWVKDSQGWCYVGADGYCVTDTWMKDSKGWVYLDASGRMATNKWVKDSQGWCYLGADGYCVTETWIKDSKGWVYLDENGWMLTAKWLLDGGKWYYLDAEGYMVTGTQTIAGKVYTFNASGVLCGF